MTPDQWSALELYFRDLLNRMELRDWTMVVDRSPTPEGVIASVDCCENRKYVTLYVCPNFAGMNERERREALVHEALHPHFDEAHRALVGLEKVVGTAVFSVADLWFRSGLEHGVDAVSYIIAPHMPPCTLELPAEAGKADSNPGAV